MQIVIRVLAVLWCVLACFDAAQAEQGPAFPVNIRVSIEISDRFSAHVQFETAAAGAREAQ
jgi:hypothetical protein